MEDLCYVPGCTIELIKIKSMVVPKIRGPGAIVRTPIVRTTGVQNYAQ